MSDTTTDTGRSGPDDVDDLDADELGSPPGRQHTRGFIFGEMLVFDALRRQTQAPRARLALICSFIEEAFGTVFRQIALTIGASSSLSVNAAPLAAARSMNNCGAENVRAFAAVMCGSSGGQVSGSSL